MLRLSNWDTFRCSDRHCKNVLEVMECFEKYNAWFKEYVSGVEASLFKKIQDSFPELFDKSILNFRFYAKFSLELKEFILLNILRPSK